MLEMCKVCEKVFNSSTETIVREIGTLKFETECPCCGSINSMIQMEVEQNAKRYLRSDM